MSQAKVLSEKEVRKVLLYIASRKHSTRNRAMFVVLNATGNREHELTLTMHLPIVNDGIKVVRDGQQAREYEVTPGTDTVSLVSKKKDGRG